MAGWLQSVIGRPRQAHGAKTPQEYLNRATSYRRSMGKRMGVPTDMHDDMAAIFAYVSSGRWVVNCQTPGCNNGPSADPEWRLAVCYECGTVYRNVVVPTRWKEYEYHLLRCPDPQIRHCFPFAPIALRYGLQGAQSIKFFEQEMWWHHSWTAPRTWTTGEIVTASIMNTHVRDDLLETAVAKATAQGDIFYATAVNAIARLAKAAADGAVLRQASSIPAWLALGTAGQVIRVNSGATDVEFGLTTTVVKAADETLSNPTALQNDDHLKRALAANIRYGFLCVLFYKSASATHDFKFGFTVPTAAAIRWHGIGLATGGGAISLSAAVTASAGTATFDTVAATDHVAIAVGHVSNGANAGDLQNQWAVANSDAGSDLTVYNGSLLKVWQAA